MKSKLFLVAVLVLSLGSGSAWAQGKGKKKQKEKVQKVEQGDRSFGSGQERTIRAFFTNADNLKGLPPGLAKREELPPGLKKHLQKNGTLPPGLQKKVQALPRSLEAQLPPLESNLRRAVIGSAVVLLEKGSNKIVDLIEEVIPR